MFQEITRVSCGVSKNDEATLYWHNSVLAIRTEKHILIYELAKNLCSLDKKITIAESATPICKDSPMEGLIPRKFLSGSVNNIVYTEMMLNPSLWPFNEHLVQEMAMIVDVKWSNNFKFNKQCVLSVVNNIGNINILARVGHTWEYILDISKIIKSNFLAENLKQIETIENLKDVAACLETSLGLWGPSTDQKSLFATVQKNGRILFWQLENSLDNSIVATFMNEIFEPSIGELIAMIWKQKSDENFLLFCSNIHGQVYCLNCYIREINQVEFVDISCLWSHRDKMISKCLRHLIINDYTILFFNKNRHLVVQILDQKCTVLMQSLHNLNDYPISDITVDKDVIISTANFKFFKVIINMTDYKVNVVPVPVENEKSYAFYKMHSLVFSSNGCICAVAGKEKKVLHRQKTPKSVDIIFFINNQLSTVSLLLENPSKKLTYYYDCVELLRVKILKTKMLPAIDYDKLYEEATSDVYKLKLYYIFLTFLHLLESSLKNKERICFKEMSIEAVKDKILLFQACKVLNELLELQKRNNELENFHLQSYCGAKNYVKYYCEKYQRQVTEFVNTQVWGIANVEDKKTCQSCDEVFEGFTCDSGHFNMFCSVTFTPIEGLNYLACKICDCTARIELKDNNPLCVFCDLELA